MNVKSELGSLTKLALALAVVTAMAAAQDPVVRTKLGQVRGVVVGDVVAFKGIPFAAPPVGDLRWRAPQPATSWKGIRDASAFAPACPQGVIPGMESESGTSFSEDCLYLNVWAPRERGERPLPVLFWVHGGGFVNGRGGDPYLTGTAMAREGVIVVQPSYRLGRFGFFAHPALTAAAADEGRLANYAILDQIAALVWVRDDIRAFGGDPDRVTIFGGSAGGASVHCLMISPLARGLFAGAIAQSGLGRVNPRGGLGFPVMTPAAETNGVAFAKKHGIDGEGAEALARLRALPVDDIVDGLQMSTIGVQRFTGPIVDGTVIPAPIEDAYARGLQAGVPLIVGGNDADGFYPFYGGTRDQVFAPFGNLRKEAEALYDPDGDDLRTAGIFAAADVLFLEPARNIARLHAGRHFPTWEYRFSIVPEALRGSRLGAWHASEMAFLFDSFERPFGEEPTANDLRAGKRLRAYWLAFARTGRPAPEGLPAWPRFDADDDVLMEFTAAGPIAHPDPAKERLDFAERVATHRSGSNSGR